MAYKILEKEEIAPSVHRTVIDAPDVAKAAKAGQFIILKIDEEGERIPLTIADFNPEKGTITVIFQEMGKTTKQLGKLSAGDSLEDFVGPLGTPADIRKLGTVILVGGGVGVAPIYPQAKAYKEAGNRVLTIIGARNKDLLILEAEMQEASSELFIATDDGSKGHHGFVTEIMKDILDSDEPVARVVIIGPPIMMKVGAGMAAPYDVEILVSLNSIMVDGTGMCGGCRVTVGGETKFTCVDGPEFDARQVDFGELMNRLSMYRDDEAKATEEYEHKCRCGLH
ncbi:putative electron-transfer protein [Methanosarcina sp. MTP4]|uniref:sulfide/dihydroorotate dehydrogenase-like FAD/NAD-binding protein n=1 Tax=Methanosarcina sp. MTP4 TaxID=1434100 RepID=UPI0006155538|nr:sulfide/dihydroorotate dehydrogenase-like FAD/NAD-binding protein [Methanosarcina sp. MTP4]AKB24183.1 putative electron-transfer protein [Methanosarcina sp. MTP4]